MITAHSFVIDERRHRLEQVEPGTLGALVVGQVGPRCSTWVRTIHGMRLLVASQPERPDRLLRAAMVVGAVHALAAFGMLAA